MAENDPAQHNASQGVSMGRLADDLALVERVCAKAGEIALGYFGASQANEVWYKTGNSPVSQADMAVNDCLQSELLSARPEYGWLSEETLDDDEARKKRAQSEFSFVVDPIDGTRGFIENKAQWCISVAVVRAGRPVVGVLACPVLAKTYAAVAGGGAFVNRVRLSERSGDALRAKPITTGSRKLIALLREAAADIFEVRDFVPSLAFRLAMVADGEIDTAFARPGAKAWDVAAAHVILQEAGCVLKTASGGDLSYQSGNIGPESLIACPEAAFYRVQELAKQLNFLQKHFTFK